MSKVTDQFAIDVVDCDAESFRQTLVSGMFFSVSNKLIVNRFVFLFRPITGEQFPSSVYLI